jgi:hypothetical protein
MDCQRDGIKKPPERVIIYSPPKKKPALRIMKKAELVKLK